MNILLRFMIAVLPFCTYALPLFSSSGLNGVGRDPKKCPEQKFQPELFVHQIQRRSVGIDITTSLGW
jgi:hypothetical protein